MSEQDEKVPDNHVVAVFHADSQADMAARELERKGYGEPVMISGGREASEKIEVEGEHSNPVTSFFKTLAGHLSEQVAFLEQYEEEARLGRKVLAVKVEDKDQVSDVTELLKSQGGVNIRYFGTFAVSDLTPETNPSASSDHRP
jgi:hypothetical protein